jgi:cold shock CspA family protein
MTFEERLRKLMGPNAMRMKHDEVTPPCLICEDPHAGVLTPCYLLLRGNYVFSPQHGAEVFVFDPELQVEFFELQNGQKACFVDVNQRKKTAAIIHDDCAENLQKKLQMLANYEMYPEDMEDDEDEEGWYSSY